MKAGRVFLGSYVGGALGGEGALLAMYLTLKNTLEIQQKNKEDTDNQVKASNNIHEKERKEDNGEKEREIRRAFVDNIAQLLGVYIANISNYHYSSIFSQNYLDSKNLVYSEMNKVFERLTTLYRSIEQKAVFDGDMDMLTIKMKRLELEYEKRKTEYLERKRECDENCNRGNRIEANEAVFTIESKLEGIQEADEFLECLHDVHKNQGHIRIRDWKIKWVTG